MEEEAPRALVGRTRRELEQLAEELCGQPYRGRQLADALYKQGVLDLADAAPLPAPLRQQFAGAAPLGRSEVRQAARSSDGTIKLLLGLPDGPAIETVVLPYPDRVSVCVSSQVGCPVGCTFCATATMGFGRNLTAGEIVDQVLWARCHSPGRPVSHVVFMGMGEPMLNYEELIRSLGLLHGELGLSYRRITVSTAGHVPGILRLASEKLPITLALSLHAPDDATRGQLIPMSRKWGVTEVMDAVRDYGRITGRRPTLEYLLLAGVNDSPEQAKLLAGLARDAFAHVNLIPWNAADSLSPFETPSRNRVRSFRETLEAAGVSVTQRVQRGEDIDAACGQLAVRAERSDGVRLPLLPSAERARS